MTLHRINYSYWQPEWSAIELDIDPDLDFSEKEAIALAEIREGNFDIADIEIESISEI